jgi:hypothetical protein
LALFFGAYSQIPLLALFLFLFNVVATPYRMGNLGLALGHFVVAMPFIYYLYSAVVGFDLNLTQLSLLPQHLSLYLSFLDLKLFLTLIDLNFVPLNVKFFAPEFINSSVSAYRSTLPSATAVLPDFRQVVVSAESFI